MGGPESRYTRASSYTGPESRYYRASSYTPQESIETEVYTEQRSAPTKNNRGREQQASKCFGWTDDKLSKFLGQLEHEEKRTNKRKQRKAGTKRLKKLREIPENTQDKANAKKFWGDSDLNSGFKERRAAKVERKRKAEQRKAQWGKRWRDLRTPVKARTDHRLVRKTTPDDYSRAKCVQSIYTPVRDFASSPSKCNLVFDKNRNVLTKEKALKKVISKRNKQSKRVKSLDKELSVLESEKGRLLNKLGSLRTEGKKCSPVLKRLDTLNKKQRTLSARRHKAVASPSVSFY